MSLAGLGLRLDFAQQPRIPRKNPARHLPPRLHPRHEQLRHPRALRRLQREMQDEVPLPRPQMIRMPVARLDDQHLARAQPQLHSVQLAKIGTALHQNRLIARMPVARILVILVHDQPVKIGEHRLDPRPPMPGVHPMVTLFFEHDRTSSRRDILPVNILGSSSGAFD